MTNIKGLKVAGYVRVSTEEQKKEGISLANQEDRIRAFAYAKGWDLVKIYTDGGYSGKNLKRPGIQELLSDLDGQQFKGVIVYKLDRLTRRTGDLWNLLDNHFQKRGIDFISVTESFDTTTANGRVVLNILSSLAQWERDIIGERTKDALKHLKDQGKKLGRPQEQDKDVVRYIYTLRKTGLSVRGITGRLDREGIRTRQGKPYHSSMVGYILKHKEFYGGTSNKRPIIRQSRADYGYMAI